MSSRRVTVALLAPAIVLAAVTAIYIAYTRAGIGLSPDSVFYTEGARSLAHGDGYTAFIDITGRRAIVDFPPLYSTLLAVLDVGGIGPLAGARLLNGGLLLATALLVYLLTLRWTGGNRAAAVLVPALYLLSLGVLRLYGFVWTEPLFVLLVVLWALAIDGYLRRGGCSALTAVAVLVAASILTRYVGVALLLASVVAILALGPDGRRRRLQGAGVVSAVGVLTALAWTVWTRVSGVETKYTPAFHGIEAGKLEEGIDSVSSWVFPSPVPEDARPWLLGLSLLAAVVVVVVLVLRRDRERDPRRDAFGRVPGLTAMATFAAVYVGFLLFSMTFISASGRLIDRYLAPVFLVVLILVAVGLARSSRPVRVAGFAVLLLLVVAYTVNSVDAVAREPISERGITAKYYARSPLLDVAEAQRGRLVYSDRPETIYANSRIRTVDLVPKKYDPYTLRANTAFDEEVRRIGSEVLAGNAVVIMWNAEKAERHDHLLTAEELVQRIDGLDSRSFPSGVVFFAASRGSPTG